jgi:hypothetical protein
MLDYNMLLNNNPSVDPFSNIMQGQQMARANVLNDLNTNQLRMNQTEQVRKQNAERLLGDIISNNMQDGRINWETVLPAYAQYDPNKAIELQQQFMPVAYKAQGAYLDPLTREFTYIDSTKSDDLEKKYAQHLQGVRDDFTFKMVKENAQNAGVDTSLWPQNYDKDAISKLSKAYLPLEKSLALDQKGSETLSKEKQAELDRQNKLAIAKLRESSSIYSANLRSNNQEKELEFKKYLQKVKLGPTPVKAIYDDYNSVKTSLNDINNVLNMLEKYGKSSIGAQNIITKNLSQYSDEEGILVRGAIADIGSKIFKERSGAAVTESEAQRIKSYIPAETDSYNKVKGNLEYIKSQLEFQKSQIEDTWPRVSGKSQGQQGPSVKDFKPNVSKENQSPKKLREF